MKKFLLLAMVGVSLACSENGRLQERDIARAWCDSRGGKTGARLNDPVSGTWTFCDCLTKKYAIEVDWAGKWEAVEQALHYARVSGRKPGILFICRSPKDRKKIRRTIENLRFYKIPIKIWRKNC